MSKTKYPTLEEILNWGKNVGSKIKNSVNALYSTVQNQSAGAQSNGATVQSATPTSTNTQNQVLYEPVSQEQPRASGGSSVLYTPGSQAPTNGDPLSYSQWLYGKSIYDAEQMRLQAEKQAETDRQRAIIDANSAYQQGLSTYGANAETMASMGLSGSGYGEYLTGKAYATQRGEVQNANVTAQARKDQALYEENSAKTQAAQIYANDLIGIKNQQNADYGSLYDSAMSGASIEALMQDGRWNSLTPEQQSIIRQITSANSVKAQIEGGATLDEIKAGNVWAGLTVDTQQQLSNYYNTLNEAKTAESENNFKTYLSGIQSGAYTLEDVKNLSGYSKLSPEQTKRLESAYDSEINVIVSSLSEAYKDNWNNLNDVKKTLSGLGYSENVITDFVSRWQENNLEDFKSMEVLEQTTIDNAVAEGVISSEGSKTLKPTGKTYTDSFNTGEMSSESYIEIQNDKSASKFKDGWNVSGYGTGGKGGTGDKFTLVLNPNWRGVNKDATYRLTTTGSITDSAKIKRLNTLATGSPDKTPSTALDSFLGNAHNQKTAPGKIVVYEGDLYIYTLNGWCSTTGIEGTKVKDVVAALLSNKI